MYAFGVYVQTNILIHSLVNTHTHTHDNQRGSGNVLQKNNNLDLPTDRPELLIVNEICNQK